MTCNLGANTIDEDAKNIVAVFVAENASFGDEFT